VVGLLVHETSGTAPSAARTQISANRTDPLYRQLPFIRVLPSSPAALVPGRPRLFAPAGGDPGDERLRLRRLGQVLVEPGVEGAAAVGRARVRGERDGDEALALDGGVGPHQPQHIVALP